MKRLVIVNKKKFMLSMTLIITLILGIFFSMYTIINKAECAQEMKYIEVYVEPGDTIWKIARKYTPINRDIRKVVYEIGLINNLKDYNIFPGQVIKIPFINEEQMEKGLSELSLQIN